MPTTVQRLEYQIGMGASGFARGVQTVLGGLRQMGQRVAQVQQSYNRATEQITRGLDAVRQRTDQVAQASRRAQLALVALAGVMTVGASKTAAYADQMKGLAEQTGLTTEEIQALGYAAEQSNADLQLLATGLRAFVRRAAEAARGNATFRKEFERIGVSVVDADGQMRSTMELLVEVADRVQAMGSEAEASATLMNLMSDAGRQLVPFMRQGGRAIRELTQEAERLGLVMDAREIERWADLNDAMDGLRARAGALGRDIMLQFLPAFELVVGWIGQAVDWFRDLDDETKAQITRWGLFGAAVLGAVAVLGLLASGVGVALQALTLLAGGIAFVLSPLGLGLVLLIAGGTALWTAWNEDWGGLRTRITGWAKDVGEALRSLGDWISGSRPAEVMRQFVADLQEIWADEELTFGEKVVETLRLIPGVGWVVGFVADLRAIWAREDLTLQEKLVETLKVLPGVKWVTGFVADLRRIWSDEELSLGEKLVETFKLLPGVKWITDFIADLRKAWDEHKAEITLAAPALAFAGLTAALLLGALFRIPGVGFVLRGATALLTIPARVAAFTISLAFHALQWFGALGLRAIMAALNVITLGARWVLLGSRWSLRFLGPVGLWITIGALAWEYGLDWARSLEEFRRDVAERLNSAIRSWFAERGLGWLGDTLFGDPLSGAEEKLQGYQTGGIIPGSRRGDRVPILAEEGEAIVPRDVVQKGLGAIVAWFLGQGVRHGIRGFQAGGLVGIDPGLAAGIEQQQGILSGLEGALMSMARAFLGGLQHALDLLVTVLTAIGKGLLGEERWAQFQAAIDAAREKVSQFVDALIGPGGSEEAASDMADAAQEAAKETRTWRDRLRDAGRWAVDFTKRTLTGLGNMILASAPIAEGAMQAATQGMQSGGPIGAVAGVFLSLLGSSRQFAKLMERINPILQAAADVVGAFLTPLIPLVQLLAEQLQPVLQQMAPAFAVLGEILAAILLPVVQAFAWVMDKVVLPVFETVAKIIASVWNAIASAINWALGWLGVRVPKINVDFERDESITTEPDTGDEGKGGSGGPAFAELAGPARDLLVELLRPLARLDTWTGYFERIAAFLSEIRDILRAGFSVEPLAEAARAMQDVAQSLGRLATDGLTIQPSAQLALAGGAGGELNLTIVYPDDLEDPARLDALAQALSRWLGRSVSLKARAQRGRI